MQMKTYYAETCLIFFFLVQDIQRAMPCIYLPKVEEDNKMFLHIKFTYENVILHMYANYYTYKYKNAKET